MFWRKKQTEAVAIPDTDRAVSKKTKKGAAKKLSMKDVIVNEMLQLVPGQVVSRELEKTYGGGLAIVELNPAYPGKGKKYSLFTDKLVDGKPAGKRTHFWDADKPKDIADWIDGRSVEHFKK